MISVHDPQARGGGTCSGEQTPCRVVALAGVVTLVAFVAVLLGGATAPAQAAPPDLADAVLDWNRYAVEALVNVPNGPPNAGQSPPVSIIHLAMVQGAVYDAVNMIDAGHEAYLDDLPAAPGSASTSAAAATAAHHVLVGMVIVPPLSSAILDRLDGLYADSLAAVPDGRREDGRDRSRSGGCRGDAHRSSERRQVRAVPVHVRRGRRANGGLRRPRSVPRPPAPATRTPGWRGSSRSCWRARRSSARRGRTRSRAAHMPRSTTR